MAICHKMNWSKKFWDELDSDTQEWHTAYFRELRERKNQALIDISNSFTAETNPYAAIVTTLMKLALIEGD